MINKAISQELKVHSEQVDAAVALLDEGATVPFIARYRKEVTGGLDDIQLRYSLSCAPPVGHNGDLRTNADCGKGAGISTFTIDGAKRPCPAGFGNPLPLT